MHQGLAKFLAGLVVADLIAVVWLGVTGYFPLEVLGITFPESSVLPIAIFDAALLVVLIHFGWHTNLPVRSPTEKTMFWLVGVVFSIVSLAHLTRIAFGWDVVIGSFFAPGWLSWLGVIFTGYLAYSAFHFAKEK